MEDDLDAISRGESGHVDYLHGFYFGNGTPGLKQLLADKVEEIDARDIGRILIGTARGGRADLRAASAATARSCSRASAARACPTRLVPDELTVERAVEMLNQAEQAEQPLGHCPETGKPVFLKIGRFGPYVQRGTAEDEEKPKNASLLKGMKPEDVTLEVALKLLSLPRELGADPKTGQNVVAHNGRFGPYVKSGDETRSLPADLSPIDVTLEQCP